MANIKNKKIPKIRFDKSNVDPQTINRALDNIIDTLNPFVEQVANELNAAAVVVPTVTSSITIHPSGAAQIQGNDFYLTGANGISFQSNGTNTLTISQVTSSGFISAITASADSGSAISGSSFIFQGSGGTSTYTIAPNTIVIDSPTVSGTNGISVNNTTSSVLASSTIALGHFNSSPTFLTDNGMAGQYGGFTYYTSTGVSYAASPSKFGSGSMAHAGNVGGNVGLQLQLGAATGALGTPYLENADGSTGDFTYEFWVNPTYTTTAGFQGLAQIGGSGGYTGLSLWMYLGELRFGLYGATNATGYYLTAGVWQAIAICRKGGTIRLFVDGSLVYTLAGTPNLGTGANALVMGWTGEMSPSYGGAEGYYDEMRFSNAALYTASYTPATSEFDNYVSGVISSTSEYVIGLANDFLHVQTQTGSFSGSQLNLVGDCTIQTSVSGSNVVISSLAKQLTGSANITVAPASTQVVANPNTTFLWHADNGNLATASTNDGYAANCTGGFQQQPLVSQQPAHSYISTANPKFGQSSFFFDGDTTGYIPSSIFLATGSQVISGSGVVGLRPDLTGFQSSSGTFTLEGWFYPDFASDSVATLRTLWHINQSNALNYGLYVGAVKANISNQLYLSVDNGVGNSLGTTPVGSLTNAAWNHIAIVRSGTGMVVYINGVDYLSGTSPNLYSADQVQLGGYGSTNQYVWKGYADEVRISNGTAVYTASFSAPTAAFGNYFSSSNNGCLDQVSLNNNISLTSVTASGGFSGNLYGTASYATNALSASFATTASYATNALSSSFATSASYATNALSASYATNAATASSAVTASYALNGAVGGDLSGSTTNAVVVGLQGRQVLPDAPLDGESLVWSSILNAWYPNMVSGSGSGSALLTLPAFHETGTVTGSPIEIQLPNGATQFPVSDIDYVVYNLAFKETSGSNWVNDIGSVEVKLSGSHLYAVIGASDAYAYNFNATNTNISSSTQFSPPRYYGSFCDLTTQTASNITTAYPMLLGVDEGSNGFNIISGSQITAQYAGTYNLQFSAQLTKNNASSADIKIWLRKNGTNVPRTATKVTLAGNGAAEVAAWNFVVPMAVNDYVQLMWWTNDTNSKILYENSASNPTIPQIPSVIATIQQV